MDLVGWLLLSNIVVVGISKRVLHCHERVHPALGDRQRFHAIGKSGLKLLVCVKRLVLWLPSLEFPVGSQTESNESAEWQIMVATVATTRGFARWPL